MQLDLRFNLENNVWNVFLLDGVRFPTVVAPVTQGSFLGFLRSLSRVDKRIRLQIIVAHNCIVILKIGVVVWIGS